MPKPEEVEVHNLTHLPYATWCPVCVACKGKESPHPTQSPEKERSSRPTLCMDFCFTGTSHDEAPTAVSLVCIDSWSRSIACIPTATKGKGLIEHIGEGVTYMSTQLQYQTINLKADNEGTMKKLKQIILKQRSALGLGTTLQDAVSGQKETNGMAERAIQTVRRQDLTLIQGLQEQAKVLIAHTHPLFSWAFRHAAWILNRYHRHSATGMTPYEFVAGRPYEGTLCQFGESLMVLVNRTGVNVKKGDPQWLRGVFLGKTDNNLFITWHMDGIKTSRSVKRCPHHFDLEALTSVGIHTWEVKHTTLTTRVVPRKNLPGPSGTPAPVTVVEPLGDQHGIGAITPGIQTPVIAGGASTPKPLGTVTPRNTNLHAMAKKAKEQEQLQAEPAAPEWIDPGPDEAGSDATPTSQLSHLQNRGPESDEAGSDSMSTDQEKQESQGSELLLPRAPAAVRKHEYEDVGTSSKIPRTDESPKRKFPPFNAGRVFEHNDEPLPEPGLDDICWEDTYSDIGDEEEEDEEEREREFSTMRTQDHQSFQRKSSRPRTERP